MDNPIGTKKGRDELRRQGNDDDNWVVMLPELACALGPALDGLDIADEIVEILETVTHIIDCDTLNCLITKEQIQAVKDSDKVLSKWDKWKGIRNRIRDYND